MMLIKVNFTCSRKYSAPLHEQLHTYLVTFIHRMLFSCTTRIHRVFYTLQRAHSAELLRTHNHIIAHLHCVLPILFSVCMHPPGASFLRARALLMAEPYLAARF